MAAGGLVGMPTETVYGLAADATSDAAVAKLYAAKGRPRFNPLIAHIRALDVAETQGLLSDDARRLARRFWPGPLTLVVPISQSTTVCSLARAGLTTLALRVPDHPVAQDLLDRWGVPLVAPSANPSGQLSPVSAEAVVAGLGDRIDLVLEGGAPRVGLESTIVDCTSDEPVMLRPGGLDRAELEAALGRPLKSASGDPNAPNAPGQLLRHYAPRASLRLSAKQKELGEGMLGFGTVDGDLNLSASGNLQEAAANLFAMLHSLDGMFDRIAVAPVPDQGLGEAINDRLKRAAAR